MHTKFPSIPSLLDFVKCFFCVEMTLGLFFFYLFLLNMVYPMDSFCLLSQHRTPGISHLLGHVAGSDVSVNILLRNFASTFMRDIGL